MKVTVEDATLAHVTSVLDDIRPADPREWYAGTGLFFEEAIKHVFTGEGYRKVALLDGLPLCFWGVDPGGNVWLFATETAEKYDLKLARLLKPELGKLLDIEPRLIALADARNTRHHVWLRWVGFTYREEFPVGPFGMDFKLFTKEAEPCASQH